jgi:hypothetical protein
LADLTTIFWRDIPAQVLAKSGRQTARVQLADRFQEAIDAAAMRAGLIGTDEYLAQWRRQTETCGDGLEDEARAKADRLEAEYTDEVLAGLVRTEGARA